MKFKITSLAICVMQIAGLSDFPLATLSLCSVPKSQSSLIYKHMCKTLTSKFEVSCKEIANAIGH